MTIQNRKVKKSDKLGKKLATHSTALSLICKDFLQKFKKKTTKKKGQMIGIVHIERNMSLTHIQKTLTHNEKNTKTPLRYNFSPPSLTKI